MPPVPSILLRGSALGAGLLLLSACSTSSTTPTPSPTPAPTATPTSITVTVTVGANGSVDPAGPLSLSAGANQAFTFKPASGYIINQVKLDGVLQDALPRLTLSNIQTAHTVEVSFKAIAPITPQVLNYLGALGGLRTIAGQHDKEIKAPSSSWDKVSALAGKAPGLYSSDFLFYDLDHRWDMIYEAKKKWDKGALVQLMWHAAPPTSPSEACGWDTDATSVQPTVKLTDAQWTDLTTEGGQLNAVWKQRMDSIAVYLQYLKDNGVEVLWRPLHEMNQGKFWWGGRPGASGTAKLYQITHDYLVNQKGLTNLIWTWDIQDFWTHSGDASAIVSDIQVYNPGAAYWDLVALDPYSTGYTAQNYAALQQVADAKPMAIGECQFVPTPDVLAAQPKWAFFMLWPDFIDTQHSATDLSTIYAASQVLTLSQVATRFVPTPAPAPTLTKVFELTGADLAQTLKGQSWGTVWQSNITWTAPALAAGDTFVVVASGSSDATGLSGVGIGVQFSDANWSGLTADSFGGGNSQLVAPGSGSVAFDGSAIGNGKAILTVSRANAAGTLYIQLNSGSKDGGNASTQPVKSLSLTKFEIYKQQ